MRTIAVPNEELLPEIARMLAGGETVTLKAKGNSMLPFIVGGRDNIVLQKKKSVCRWRYCLGRGCLQTVCSAPYYTDKQRENHLDGRWQSERYRALPQGRYLRACHSYSP